MKNNFVAKHCRAFNKAATHRDRTKYVRPNNNWLDEIEPPFCSLIKVQKRGR